MEMSVLTWVLTYAFHSTVLIGGVWVVCAIVPRLSLSTRESLWKVALLGGIVTASMHTAADVRSPWGNLSLPAALDTDPLLVQVQDTSEPPPETAPAVKRRIVRHQSGELTITTVRERRPAVTKAPAAPAVVSSQRGEPSPWPWVVLALAALGSIYALVRLGLAASRLRKQLRGRRDVIEDPVLETFLGLCHKVGLKKRVRLTASSHVQSPVALLRREIVLPERAVDSLSPRQQEGMLAHELAHVLRRDPLWLWIAAVVEGVLFFQPLNRLARRQIQQVAELQCDDWAARHTGTGVHLAKCLAEVASWIEQGPPQSPMATMMAEKGSPIVRRITRLLDDKRRKRAPGNPVGGVALGCLLMGLVTWLVPGVTRAAMVWAVSDAEARPPQQAASMTVHDDPEQREVVFHDVRGEDGRDRSHVRVHTRDEIVEVEIEREHRVQPPPVPAPEEDDDGGLHIVIQGGVWGSPFDSHWHGFIGIDMGELGHALDEVFEDEVLDVSPWGLGGTDFWYDAREQARRDREQARRARQEARERAREAREEAREDARRARARAQRARPEVRGHGVFEL